MSIPTLGNTVGHVVTLCSEKPVVRVIANGVVTAVANVQRLVERSIYQFVTCAVRNYWAATKEKLTIVPSPAMLVLASDPRPTLIGSLLVDLAPPSFQFGPKVSYNSDLFACYYPRSQPSLPALVVSATHAPGEHWAPTYDTFVYLGAKSTCVTLRHIDTSMSVVSPGVSAPRGLSHPNTAGNSVSALTASLEALN